MGRGEVETEKSELLTLPDAGTHIVASLLRLSWKVIP